MRSRVPLIGLTLALVALPALAQPALELDYDEFTLDNGLKVILVEDHSAPVVAVDVWYHVGGANDPQGRSGFAHLFEHVMFQGTANLTKDELLRLVDDAGGTYNAYTALDRTAYHETLPAHQLPLGLWLEADRMSSLAVTQTNLDNQRAVVIQEYQQNYGGAPYGLALRDFYTLSYNYEPYRRAPIGNVEDLNAATVEEIRNFHETYYVPNNATLVVAGDFDPATARDLIEHNYGPIPRGETPPELPPWEPAASTSEQIFAIEDSLIRIPASLIGFEVPPPSNPDVQALDVLATILSTGDSSRLARDFIDTGAALQASAFLEVNNGPSLFGFVLLPGNITRDELEQRLFDEIEGIAERGVTQEELDKAVALIRSQRIVGMETAMGIAEEVHTGQALYGDPAAVLDELDRISAVTIGDIQRVASEYLAPDRRNIFRVDPGEPRPFVEPVPFVGAEGTPADDEWEVGFALPFPEPPESLPVATLDFPPITEVTLDNGLDVVVIEMPELPVISIDIVFRGGASLVEDGKSPAIASIAAQLLTRGTTTRSAQEIADTIESRGGVTGAYSSNDLIGFGIFALIEDRALAFDLIADMTFNPTFPEEELAVQLGQLQGGLEAVLSDPDAQLGRAFYPAVYGDHPYGEIVTADTLDTITQQALADYYSRVRHPDNALIIVAGRIEAEEALELLDAHFSEWPEGGERPALNLPPVSETTDLSIILVDVPGAQQADIMLGNLAVAGADPSRYALSVANAVLGQGLSSRLNRLVREELGLTYGVSSGLSYPVGTGTFRVSTNVQASSVAEVIAAISAEVERLRNEPIADQELTAKRDGMIGRFALSLETYQDFVSSISSYWIRDLAVEDIADYPELIAAVTPENALEAAAAHIPGNLVIVLAGDADILGPLLEDAGPVTIVPPR